MKLCNQKKITAAFLAVLMSAMVVVPSAKLAYAEDANSKQIQVIAINDFHGSIKEDASEKGKNMGMSKVINAVKAYKKANPNTIVVSAGDNYQGSAMSNLNYGAPVSEMLKEMGIVASAVGNHEFDWGVKRIDQWEKDGNFDFLAANIIDKTTKKPVEWADPYKVVEKDGVKVAFIGLTTKETAFQTLPENVTNVEFVDLKATAEKWADYLKSGKAKEGKVDVVIALTHVGSKQDRDTKAITGDIVDSQLCKVANIDAVISAHTHQAVAGLVDNKPVVQGYKNGRALGKLVITVDSNNKIQKVEPGLDFLYNRKSEIIDDQNGKAIFQKYDEKMKPILSEKVGTLKEELSHERHAHNAVTKLGNWVCDVMRKEAKTQIGIMNEGGIRRPLFAGDITVGDLYEIMPFDNTLVTMDLTGAQLKKLVENGIDNESCGWIEIAGLKATYDMSKPFGSRVVNMYLEDGTPIDMNKSYSACANDFIADGGDGYDFKEGKNLVNTMKPIRDVITDYVKQAKVVSATFTQPLTPANGTAVKVATVPTGAIYVVENADTLCAIARCMASNFIF